MPTGLMFICANAAKRVVQGRPTYGRGIVCSFGSVSLMQPNNNPSIRPCIVKASKKNASDSH